MPITTMHVLDNTFQKFNWPWLRTAGTVNDIMALAETITVSLYNEQNCQYLLW